VKVVRDQTAQEHPTLENRALAAALVHDLGHGPFSHAFEKVGVRLGLTLTYHEDMSDLLIRQSEITEALNKEIGPGFADTIADIIKKDGVKTVQHAVVSSQFDADRLDYMRRDRMMTGTQDAAIDFNWLMANLEIAPVEFGVDDAAVGTIETFVLGPKAIYAAEAFVLGLLQLYATVYFHKATRGAEKIFTELLVRVVTLIRDGKIPATGLPANHPLVRFALNSSNVDLALMLDDTVISGALTQMSDAPDPLVAEFSTRLRDRKLYKCYDMRAEVAHALDPKSKNSDEVIVEIDKRCAAINAKLTEWNSTKSSDRPRVLIDLDERSPYKSIGESKGPLDRINIRTAGGVLVDLKERSSAVAALKTYKLFRVYFDRTDTQARDAARQIVGGEMGT
jgi:HD superfamily phosphohydrolase